ncbi:hypothetical protein [Micromonospora sp. NPDC049679]|uniref:hypothetical protein n=1 Tax=Micromonospora sp. NPDC049679 TaxID=3155920 RepID=UPI0033FF0AF9
MTNWLHRAVGTIGVAGGFLLLAGGAAQAQDAHPLPVSDPQELRGTLDDFLTPTGGSDLGLTQLTAVEPLDATTRDLIDPAALGDRLLPDPAGVVNPDSRAPVAPPLGGLPALPDTSAVTDLLGGAPTGAITDLLGGAPLAAPVPLATGGAGPVDAASPIDGVAALASGTALDQLAPAPANLVPALIGDAMTAQHPQLFSATGGHLPTPHDTVPRHGVVAERPVADQELGATLPAASLLNDLVDQFRDAGSPGGSPLSQLAS